MSEHNGEENYRRILQALVNHPQSSRQELELAYGQVWDTEELKRDFEVLSFLAPLVVVKRKADGKLGSLLFQHMPRFYFRWEEHK